jgi:antitoxin component YwqK of YwqJK toxin-antitoxin module
MRATALSSILLLMSSCLQNPSEERAETTAFIPTVYTLKSSPEISVQNDTVFLNREKYSGYLFMLNAGNDDTILLEAYEQGLRNGVSKQWYACKQLMEQRRYKNGKKDGVQIAYWENGNKRFEFHAKNDVCEGEMKEWNIDGNLIHLAHYTAGQEEGAQKLWYDNGKIRANYVMIKGRRYGLLGTKNCVNVSDSIDWFK